ncbi:MAG: FAD binding domain-containing protein, partial [Hyphomicrobiales bacterium]|nr:FAD binding domain-containing protein [Hyphomicrobiales bacterium]
MYAFAYHQPADLAGALAELAREDAKLLAGGQTLIPTMKQRLASPASLVDLRKIAELVGVSRQGDAVRIGAMTRHADVARSAVVHGAIPALAELANGIGDPAVRNRGTIGG